eukprot:Skav206552  [mRNA]  locus=scaffold547:95118:96060:- [translate_table: standard]
MPWPSLGSATHHLGICKPCDFQHRTSCRHWGWAGFKCQFCHLCPPGENRRRKKQKQVRNRSRLLMKKAGFTPGQLAFGLNSSLFHHRFLLKTECLWSPIR